MKSLWSDADAAAAVARYGAAGINEDLALRTYTTRLLGSDPALVLHGGGNTSVKTVMPDGIGKPAEVICVKGSGWDMGTIEPPGLPAVRLAPLRRLRAIRKLSDEEMVNQVRLALLDSSAPNPSVETLLHAFLPHKFVDHTHANAVLSLVDQPDSAAIAREVWGDEMAFLPYVMPGFDLAGAAADAYEAVPQVKGIILDRHGIFTFGDTAREAYELMIEMVARAEARIARAPRKVFAVAPLPAELATVADIAPILRGAVAEPQGGGAWRRLILDFRTSPTILTYVGGAEVGRYARRGVVTPDHIIRTKNRPLVLTAPSAGDLKGWAGLVRQLAVPAYVDEYRTIFDAYGRNPADPKTMLDPMPRVVLVPGLGLFGLGRTRKEAAVAADVAEATVGTVTDAESVGRFTPLSDAELFNMEYWSLEQAKLSKAAERPLMRQVAVVTGGAGTIGAATAKLFAANGAEIAVLDLDGAKAAAVAKPLGGIGIACDVTDRGSVDAAFRRVVETFGGVDIVVSNAGAAWQGRIGEVDDATLRQSFELNFFGHQNVAQAAVKIMLAQGTGGALLFNASKQAVNPGANFGAYGLPKAATLFLSRQYAVDYGSAAIRSNAVNADRIRSGLLNDAMIASRSSARGVSEADYMAGNLLGLEVTAADVAEAFLHQAVALKTTGNVTTVDGGNIAAALR